MTRLTVLLDPGRLKRGVGPNRVLGPPLRTGQRYTLSIGQGMADMYGRPLREGFCKSFVVLAPIREPIAVEDWEITPPSAGGYGALQVAFPRPLDWAELWQGIAVASNDGCRLEGRVDVDQGEMRWRFTPDAPWRQGRYSLNVSPDLEDVCGNTPARAFDGPLRSTDEAARETSAQSIHFEVKAA